LDECIDQDATMTGDGIQASSTSPARRQWIAILLIVAAIVVVAPTMFRELKPRDLPGTSVLLATSASSKAEDIGLILDHPVWGEFLGDGEVVPAEARAVRLGAAIADLELRFMRGDTSAPASVAHVVGMLQTFPGSDNAVRAYQSLGASADTGELGRASQAAERVANRRLLRLGSWLRGARYAAASHDSSLFDIEAVRSLSQAAITYDARPETEFAVRQFESIARKRPHDWTALGTGANELLRRMGSR
jgi:hypothetical protein